ncbi:hypothetical protein IC235_20195 [Hymenobacter sp. BT664]|uniref:Uncharacterized protein n=1 Tax=Hymenobacter montanus TaxID=2771359 RepID=A0A927GL28_9BACT|nr:hypothetical protein [Hymenobacter montanus]MBD2770213.1 hypothetical protein [Hymenobacter montanus]
MPVAKAETHLDKLHVADALVFGCPTYLGGRSTDCEQVMELTGRFWYQ